MKPPPVHHRRIAANELPVVKRLAHEIWHACYPGIIPWPDRLRADHLV